MDIKNGWLHLCVEIMEAGIRYKWGNVESMRRFDTLAPHAAAIIEYAYAEDCHNLPSDDNLVHLCNKVGYGLRYGGKYSLSLDCYRRALSLQESVLSSMSSLRATLYYNIAWNFEEMMDLSFALQWYFKDLVICETVHGRDGISTAYTYDSIGSIFRKKHNYKKALVQRCEDIT